MRDPYAIHRDYENPWWLPDPVRDTMWTDIDYALVEAVQAVEAFTSKESGQLRWLSEDPNVHWGIGRSVDYGVQELEQESAKYKDGVPREVTLYLKDPYKDGDFWTLEEWFEYLDSNESRVDREAPEGSHAPTPEDRIAVQRAREERIAAALATADE